jgi:uroporphyrinogen-III synthase
MENKIISILSTGSLAIEALSNIPSNIQIDIQSFIETNNIVDAIKEQEIISFAQQKNNIVFTSMNAAEAVTNVLRENDLVPDWTVFCLGNATKKFVKSFFLSSNIITDAKNAKDLAELIIQQKVNSVIFFCGNIRRDELPEKLTQQGILVDEVIVYETTELKKLINKNYDGILFFSPSAVRSFFSNNTILSNTILFSIGSTTANEIKKYSNNIIEVADETSKEMLLMQTIQFFQTKYIHY